MQHAAARADGPQTPLARLEGVVLRVVDLHRSADSPAPARDRVLLDGVSLALAPGAFTLLLGASGSGKSSLLRLFNRLERARSGRVEVAGRAVQAWEIAALRRTAVLVPQGAPLLGGSVREELERPLRWAGRPAEQAPVRAALRLAALETLSHEQRAEELSGGERARLALARALVLEPRLLLLDETTASLDPRLARSVLEALARWARERAAAVVLVTHRLSDLMAVAPHAPVHVLDRARLRGPFPAGRLAEGRVGEPEIDALLGRLEQGPRAAGELT